MRTMPPLRIAPAWPLALAASLAAATATAVTRSLGADPFSVNWSVEQEQYQCQLQQAVPDLGSVRFSQSPEAQVRLELHADEALYRGEHIGLKARPPSWRADIAGFHIAADGAVGKDDKIARFGAEASERAFKAMKDGYRLQLSLRYGKPPEALSVSVEGLGFAPLLADFDDCRQSAALAKIADDERREQEHLAAEELARTLAELTQKAPRSGALSEEQEDAPPEGPTFELEPEPERGLSHQLANLHDDHRIPFDRGDTEINKTAAGMLDQWLRRWSLRGLPPELALHGHADDADATGSYLNSDLRAQAVARYLLERVPDLVLRIEAHGDTMPLEEIDAQRVDLFPSDLPDWH